MGMGDRAFPQMFLSCCFFILYQETRAVNGGVTADNYSLGKDLYTMKQAVKMASIIYTEGVSQYLDLTVLVFLCDHFTSYSIAKDH